MASAWGKAWGKAWGSAWGRVVTIVTGRREVLRLSSPISRLASANSPTARLIADASNTQALAVLPSALLVSHALAGRITVSVEMKSPIDLENT